MFELRLGLYEFRDLFYSASEGKFTLIRLSAVLVDAAHLHDLVDHHKKILAGNTDPVRVLHYLGGILRVLHKKYYKSRYRVQGCSQIMGHSLEHAAVHSHCPVIEDLMKPAAVSRSALRVKIYYEIAVVSSDSLNSGDTSVISLGQPCPPVDALCLRMKDRAVVLFAVLLR